MRQRRTKHKAIIRAFDIILTFESDKRDSELEEQVHQLLEDINEVLKKRLTKELPQVSFDSDDGKKKIKLGIRPLDTDLTEDDDF